MKILPTIIATFLLNGSAAQLPGGRYIVKFENRVGSRDAIAAASEVHSYLELHDAIAATYTEQAIQDLSNNPNIAYVEEDGLKYLNDFESSESHTLLRQNRRRLAQDTPYGIIMVEADQVTNADDCTKKICIIDSGYDLVHEDLPTTDVEGSSFMYPWDIDANGHGMIRD